VSKNTYTIFTVLLIVVNVAIFIGGIVLLQPEVERQIAVSDNYYKNITGKGTVQTANKLIQFAEIMLVKEPYESYAYFRQYTTLIKTAQEYCNDFYTYYFKTMQKLPNTGDILPPERIFNGFTVLYQDYDYKKLTESQKTLVDAVVPLKTFAVWYTKRTELGYSKHQPLFEISDETMLSYARNFIEYFSSRDLAFEYLSRIIALELELLYRSSRMVSFWDANQRWDNAVLKRIYKRIQEYKERFYENFTVHATGAVNWILNMEQLADHEISDRGFFVNREQKEALEREAKLLGAIPGLKVELLTTKSAEDRGYDQSLFMMEPIP